MKYYNYDKMSKSQADRRLEAIRKSLRSENISMGELVELHLLAQYINKDDVELLEPAGVKEFSKFRNNLKY